MQRESATMIDKLEVKGSVSVAKPQDAPEPQPVPKGKAAEPEPVPEADDKKFNTLLRYDIERREPDPDPEAQRLKFLFDCPDISELVSAAEIENYEAINHMIDDFDYFEDLSGVSAFQVMHEVFNKFNCVNYKYCEVTDCFILMFFNSHDKEGIAREEWRGHLSTPVCLQDFFDFTLDEHYEWIQNEEKMYDENNFLRAKSQSKDFIDPNALKSCVEDTEVEMDLLMEGSLKYQEIVQVEETPQDITEDSDVTNKKSMPNSIDVGSKSSKKTKSASTPKTLRQSFVGRADNAGSIEIPAKPFLGYDLGDRRVEVFGKDAIYFSRDGTKITSAVVEEPEIPPEKSKKSKSKAKLSKNSSKSSKTTAIEEDKNSKDKPVEYEVIVDDFEIIETNGLRQKWICNTPYDIEKLLIRTATDYSLGEVFSRRMDGTNILLNKDGIHLVTFPNKTRIITSYIIEKEEIYPEWTDVEIEYFEMFDPVTRAKSKDSVSQKSFNGAYSYNTNSSCGSSISAKMEEEENGPKGRTDGYVSIHLVYTIEHSNFSTVTIDCLTGKISVDSPNETTISVDKENNYDIKLDNLTNATFDGENLHISYEACSECRSFTNCDVKIMRTELPLLDSDHWLKMKDSFNWQVVVNEEGSISVLEEQTSAEMLSAEVAGNTEGLVNTEVIVNREGVCTEPAENTETAVKTEEQNAARGVVEDKAPDVKSETSIQSHGRCKEIYHAKNIRFFILKRELTCAELINRTRMEQYKRNCRWQPWCTINQYDTFGDHRSLVSMLTPVHLTETEKWLMESKLAAKPKYLAYKDLKKDCGKGFYHWMRPYDRFEPKPMKPENVLPKRLPRAYILRTLEREWGDTTRENLKGARELLKAVLRYRCIMESESQTILNIPIIDLRPEDERQIDDIIQAIAHKSIYIFITQW
ncbi:unnamed protein product [Chrysodeixis includens]|uniref:Uncharacterized protein n=1 Tax=Chrysodeixis includens TaxID=689277 RepID=A0A9P0FQW3_CHRIL|nr:unnamed protein product [Chrysodeixis includens]